MSKVRNPVAINAPRRTLHLVPTGMKMPKHCVRCGEGLIKMGAHWTDDAAVHRLGEHGTILLQLDDVDAAYNFSACKART